MSIAKFLSSAGLVSVLLAGCGGSPSEVMNAEFRSLSACLEGIKSNSGQSLNVITDKPDKVSGKLANGETFACTREESGTKGTYFAGWYTMKE